MLDCPRAFRCNSAAVADTDGVLCVSVVPQMAGTEHTEADAGNVDCAHAMLETGAVDTGR